jgi:hypothetical protein
MRGIPGTIYHRGKRERGESKQGKARKGFEMDEEKRGEGGWEEARKD